MLAPPKGRVIAIGVGERGKVQCAKRDAKAAARFFRQVLKGQHTQAPRVINVGKHAAYPAAMEVLKEDAAIDQETPLRQSKYLNNVDASIMPTLTTGNTNAPTIMIGEKAADLIRAKGFVL